MDIMSLLKTGYRSRELTAIITCYQAPSLSPPEARAVVAGIMSFMFNPHPYDDSNAINRLALPDGVDDPLVHGTREVAIHLANHFAAHVVTRKKQVIALDGYIGAGFDDVLNLTLQQLALKGVRAAAINAAATGGLYKPAHVLEAELAGHLPNDRMQDPVLLFGKLFHGKFEDLFDDDAVDRVRKSVTSATDGILFVYGCGCTAVPLRDLYDTILYFDVTPKRVILRAKAGLVANIGDTHPRPFKELLRRLYYVDFEVAGALRRELLHEKSGAFRFYIARNAAGECTLLPRAALDATLASLARQPFRCRPVYIEGVWGGSFVQRIRNLPADMVKVAWVFDLIPLEVSIVVETAAGRQIEFPYFTFVQKEGEALMGPETVKRFGGYFPIRFNYDDTWHASGNMSIQVHPTREYCIDQNGEHGQQDESYYVVATGHGAKTYLGFREGVTKEAFMREARRSEAEKTPMDHDAFVHAVPSRPGTQLVLPGGTIHASGQNQVVLEIGSLTVGSYTYKLYDYLRADLDGNPRPIHTYHGENVLDPRRVAPQVERELVPEPKLLRKGASGAEGWSEWLVGEHEDVYFSLRRIDIAPFRQAPDDTRGVFHVLALVDGEAIVIESQSDPARCYHASYLDIVVVPANIGPYTIRNPGKQPVVVHKTLLK
ncbi:phosphomannose isomerase [Opitutaceae bacterium TAV1]|nr:phosphomannose isomerase [Opitutaceae bacterium TAV1]